MMKYFFRENRMCVEYINILAIRSCFVKKINAEKNIRKYLSIMKNIQNLKNMCKNAGLML